MTTVMERDEKSQGFDKLMADHEVRVRRFAFHLMGNQEEAEDLIQDTWIAAFRNFNRFRGDCRFSTWLFQIEKNLGINKIKARKPTSSLDNWNPKNDSEEGNSYLDSLHSRDSDPSQKLEKELQHINIIRVIGNVPGIYGEAAWLRDVEGISYEGVAEFFGIPINTAKSHIRRGRTEARRKLQAENIMYTHQTSDLADIITNMQNRLRLRLEGKTVEIVLEPK